MLANALTSIGHFDEVIDYSLIFYFLFGAFLPAFLIFQTKISPVKTSTKFVFSFIICNLYLCCYLSLAPNAINKIFTIYSPINYVGSFYKYGERFCGSSEKKKSRVDLDKFYNFDYQPKFKDLNVVVIIGESLRADHLHFNGYLRNTTPNLENIKNLLHYKAKASFNTTTPSVTSLLSHRTKAEFVDIPPEKSIISVFKNLGFKTYWYSAQSSKEFGNGMLNIMASEADDYFFIDKLQTSLKANDKVYDGSLLPFLQNALASGGNKFIILHSFGSHIRYSERSPAEFKKFQPECTSAPYVCKRVLAMNAYDNSVLYTDHFISSVIKSLENTNSILFYVSDHGVFFGENNVYANGNSDQIDNVAHIVPMFLYMTDSVLKNKDYRKKFETAKSKTNATNLSHDNFFDSIIDCSGIKSIILKRDLSLCNH
jgi:glucan phosphoethanolaminetransferase (alkaline phosphatase superfamily)